MSHAIRLDPIQRDFATWGVMGLIAVAVGYVVIKYAIPAIAKAAANSAASATGSAASGVGNTLNAVNQGLGTNNLTTSQTDWGGDSVDYTGHGVISTLGAEANALTGGLAASGGEGIGSGLFSLFGSTPSGSTIYYTVTFPDGSKHAIGDATIDASGNFSYGGVQYRMGDDGYGNKVATALTTIYGSGGG